ncbi:ATP-binding cassette domain-containing protein [Anaerocolumna sedimenticola]|uniref:Autoinducer 2 import ATP-binding protein LsrA n=1 Tax=Anaerocolumna sedimenticola TaxID=2696063 RepID=A0A6P1TG02_9FIRM|nr:sugar ABC transporter ATP-binding protein [Anaerocolumna sedimenticola]QHQ60120.1 ATP-binding cassette domain-containing protein [Anaerocolumna sedimenticola]
MSTPALLLKDIDKYMSEDFSLSSINLDLFYGEVHALIGENGSGKSMIINVINGIFKMDSGHIYLDGQEINVNSVYEAKKIGIHSVLQEMALYPNLTIAENVYADKLPYKNSLLHWIDFDRLFYNCKELFTSLNINLNPDALLGTLGFAQKHLIEMIKAYISDAKIIIFDEPSSTFSPLEKEILFRIITELKSKNKAIIYITHSLDEIKKIADRVTVTYKGKVVGTRNVKEISTDEIIKLMAMSKPHKRYPKLDLPIGRTVLSVKNLSFSTVLSDINFELNKSEILGVTGLVGSGRSLLAKCIFGVNRPTAGSIEVNGRPVTIREPFDAIKEGIALLPEDRINSSVFGSLNLQNNVSVSSLKRFVQHMIIDPYILRDVSGSYVEKLSIKPGNADDMINTYSGGNQQKMAVARWMMSRLKIYIMDEPTRGVDIASKTDIYNCMVDLVRKGASIVFISSDIDEIMGMCDRILVLNSGRLVCDIPKTQATKEEILMYAAKE